MPKYLVIGNYTADGVKGLMQEGGSSRRAMAEKLAESLGGRLECMYFAFGADDLYAIVDLPGNVAAAAVGLTAAASGATAVRTVVLLTPEEVDEATAARVEYRPPGR